ncbi:hypothetical protein [Streptomyces sp. NPDC048106]|uniref:hypothetical protein n=1 Tax=Streptomyces sp. NPDC048106 TaxID=3155750 RepID=UPI003456A136
MARHLIDDVAIGWDELGTDLLDGAPPAIVTALTGGEQWPSRALDNFLITPDGSPPVRMTVTERTAVDQELTWGYILRPKGIEVISVQLLAGWGPVVGWDTDPRTRFSDHTARWAFHLPVPAVKPGRAARPAQPASGTASRRSAARR